MLDGTSLDDATKRIDSETTQKPLGFMVNCAHPSFLCAEQQPAELFDRLIGYQANASSLDHDQLDGSADLQIDSVAEWGDSMLELHRRYRIKILGGCCGTGPAHLRHLART